MAEIDQKILGGEAVVEYIPLGEYLFRYNRGGFWVGRLGYKYFGNSIPSTRYTRWLLDDYSHTRTLYHALHTSGIASRFVVQDLALPYDKADAFVEWADRALGIWPLWLDPLRGGCRLPTVHPVTVADLEERKWDKTMPSSPPISQPMFNVGVWGWVPPNRDTFVAKNRALEAKVAKLGGRKWLYALRAHILHRR